MDGTEHEELVAIRTQLTIALLAVAQLQRRHARSADAARLLTHVDTALQRIAREARKIDRLLAYLEDRAAIEADPLRVRRRGAEGQPRPGGAGHPVGHDEESTDDNSTLV